MKNLSCILGAVLAATLSLNTVQAEKFEFTVGNPMLQSLGTLAFGPEGVLFGADAKAAAIYALDTGDRVAHDGPVKFHVIGIDTKVAAMLGTTSEEIQINDLAVNPVSLNAYLSVARGRGPDAMPVLVRVTTDGNLDVVDLTSIGFAKATLPNPPADAEVGEGRRRRNHRMESITDLDYFEGNVIVAGLSNEEFSSTLRSIPFPFRGTNQGASVEIYHGAHGQFETHSPVRTFVPYSVGGESQILAAYTCTPLVRFPVADLKPGAQVMGTTIAELGNRNRPLDMVVYEKEGKDFFLMANSSRGVMKITTESIETYPAITERVGGGGIEGLPYETIADWTSVTQLALLGKEHALIVRETDSGAHDLEARRLP